MKETLKKISDVFKLVFGYGIMIVLFVGGLTFFGYIAVKIWLPLPPAQVSFVLPEATSIPASLISAVGLMLLVTL